MCFQKCSFVFYCFLENKTWLDSVKNLAERIPDTASRQMSKNEKEHMPTSGGSGITFVNYSELSDVSSGICTFVNKILRHSLRILSCCLWVCSSMTLGIKTWSHFLKGGFHRHAHAPLFFVQNKSYGAKRNWRFSSFMTIR